MKKLFFILLSAFQLVSFSAFEASAATLEVNTRNFTSEPTMRRRATMTLIEAGPVVAGPWLIAGDSDAKFTDTNGVCYFSNVLAGAYRLDIAGSPGRSFPITIPDTNGLLSAAAFVNSTNANTHFYTATQVDAKIAAAVSGVGGNPNALTNNNASAVTLADDLTVSGNLITPSQISAPAGADFGVASVTAGAFVAAAAGFTGSGANLTDLPAAELTGTLPALNASALTGVVAARLSQHIAAYYVTNYTENRDSIYVTGNGSSAVNGQYKVSWYDPDTFRGIWTNTASTNMILMNNPSNHASISTQPFIIAASATPEEFLYQEDQTMLGVRSVWVGGLASDGMTDFTGTASLAWASNSTRQMVLTSFAIGGTNTGIVATNLIRVSLTGSDELATRLNGYPFKTLYVASTNAQQYDLIYIEPGFHKTKPFHMDNRNFHILGAGEDVCIVEADNLQSGPDPFQSRALVPWDNCSIGGFTLTNSLIAFAQFSAPFGGTNAWAHDLTIFPPKALKFPDNTALEPSNGDQSQYFNVGVDVSRFGNNNRIERVKVYSGMKGFGFQSTASTSGTITLIDCEAYCSPEYSGSPNIWTNATFMASGSTNVGGMLPLAFSAKDQTSQTVYPITVNIIGGNFVSLNGGTNEVAYVGGETQASRNSSLWISRGYTNTVTINLSSVPRFRNGNTNTTSYAVLNEATNNNVAIIGYYTSNHIAQATNETTQAGYSSGTVATSSSSMVTMNFGTTDPELTITDSGTYLVLATAFGITSSADSTEGCVFQISSNGVALPHATINRASIDGGLAGLAIPFEVTIPPVFTALVAGDTLAVQWQSTGAGTSWQGQSASVIALRVK